MAIDARSVPVILEHYTFFFAVLVASRRKRVACLGNLGEYIWELRV